jgi:hypothetical protein
MDVFKTLLLDTPDSLNSITGTLQIVNGGTGATSAAGARDNLLPDYTGNVGKVLTVNAGATDVEWTTNGAGTVTSVDLTAGTGVSVSGGPITSSGSITVTNTAPDQTVVLTAGTGINTSGTYPNFTVTNSAPDQTVAIAAGTGISVSGSYPSFTVTNSSPSLGGDVVGPASATDNAIVRFDSTTGKLVQNSGVTISDANLLTTTDLTVNDNTTLGSSNSDTVNFNARVASDINPATDNTYDLGVTGHEWRNLNIDGEANIDSLVADTADINGGTIDATAIGGSTAAAGAFTTLGSSSTTTLNGTTIPASKTLVVTTDKLSALAATTSAELAGVISDETGTGALVFANSPTLVTPALGTPASGVVTNLTGTASININGTVGATTPSTGAFTTLSASTSVTTPSVTNAGTLALSATGANVITASTNGSERARILSDGKVLIGTTTAPTIAGVPSGSSVVRDGGGNWTWSAQSTNASSNRGMVVNYSAAAPNDTTNEMIFCYDSVGAQRFGVRSNGGIANYQANDVNLSDERVKKDITPAGSYLDKICGLEVVKYKYKDQTHDDYNLGVIAQQVEAVAPEFVDANGFNPLRNDEIPLKAIYQTDLSYGILKAVQELAEENRLLRARVAALESQ